MNTTITHLARLTFLVAATTFAMIASAADQPGSPSGSADSPPRREPPPQAYQDCKGKQAGDVVQINTPNEGNISATCTNSAKGLFARPDRPPCDRESSAKTQK